jgi:hypothetical protein
MSDPNSLDFSDDHLQELLVGYVLGQLSEHEQQQVEQLLQQQPQLQTQVDQLQAVMSALAHRARQTPSPQLRERVLAIANPELMPTSAAVISQTPVPQTPRSPLRRSLWPRLGAVVAAFVMGWLAVDYFRLRGQLHQLELAFAEVEERETLKFELKGTAVARQATASVVLDFESGKALVGVQNLPPLKPGEIYRLWAMTRDKKILCGEFNSLPSGQVIGIFPLPLKEYTSSIKEMRISREANTNPHRPETRVLMLSSKT